MASITNCLIFSVFVVVAYGRSLENNTLEISQDNNCSCDYRYFKHYEVKDCVLEKTDSCGCPQKFNCLVNQTQQAPSNACLYQNKVYEIGSRINTADICQVCWCRGHDGVLPYISCVTAECPVRDVGFGRQCHSIYKETKCCPVDVKCFGDESEINLNKTCEYNGKIYPFGAKIYPVDDPCQICMCNENWNGVDNSSCYQYDCMFEKHKSKLNAGCIPVYHENVCCPIEFYCPSSHDFIFSSLLSNESADFNISHDDQCTFAGQSYPVGKELSTSNPCVKCNCVTPPDFTCIHQACSPPPIGKLENCYAVRVQGVCCPFFECMLGDAEPLSDCPTPLCADEYCKIDIPLGQRCPTCICNGCPTPLCSDSSCHIEIPPGHECPTCICGEKPSELERNSLEQVQQISQSISQYEVQQALEPGEDIEDSSENVIQMMPIKMQNSDDDTSVLEKMILPDPEFTKIAEELQNNSIEDYSSPEIGNSGSEEARISDEKDPMSLTESELNNTYNESTQNESEKVLQKRSDVSDAANSYQTRATIIGQKEIYQQNMKEFNEDLEREGVGSIGSDENFADELESFNNKIFDKDKKIINQVININHEIKVPPGCPTPMCEGPWCKIGILPGERCPTCICRRPIPTEP